MNIEELKKQFIVEGDVLKERLEPLVSQALKHCRIDKSGQVLITDPQLSGRDQVKLVLAARAIAAQFDDNIRPEVSVVEIGKCTGLPANQIRARGKESIEDKFAESSAAGVYRAIPHKIEAFLDNLSVPVKSKEKK
jgi:hypothetical protein